MKILSLLYLLAFAVTLVEASETTHLYREEMKLKLVDVSNLEEEIELTISAPLSDNQIRQVELRVGINKVALGEENFRDFGRPLWDEVKVLGFSKNPNIKYIRLNFLSNKIQSEGLLGEKCMLTLVFFGDKYVYQIVTAMKGNSFGPTFYKSSESSVYYDTFEEMGISDPHLD